MVMITLVLLGLIVSNNLSKTEVEDKIAELDASRTNEIIAY